MVERVRDRRRARVSTTSDHRRRGPSSAESCDSLARATFPVHPLAAVIVSVRRADLTANARDPWTHAPRPATVAREAWRVAPDQPTPSPARCSPAPARRRSGRSTAVPNARSAIAARDDQDHGLSRQPVGGRSRPRPPAAEVGCGERVRNRRQTRVSTTSDHRRGLPPPGLRQRGAATFPVHPPSRPWSNACGDRA